MPDGSFIWPNDLRNAIEYMLNHKKYKYIVIYWASDYARQVLWDLPHIWSILGVASSDSYNVQKNAHCPPDDVF